MEDACDTNHIVRHGDEVVLFSYIRDTEYLGALLDLSNSGDSLHAAICAEDSNNVTYLVANTCVEWLDLN